jgi:O-antigen/teichoic acid export membrane protein
VLFLGGMLGGIGGYVFHIIMGRMLDEGDYGLLATVVAMTTVLSVPTSALTLLLARAVAGYRAHEDEGSIARLYSKTMRGLLVICTLFLATYALATPFLQEVLRVPTLTPVYLLGVLVVFSLVVPIGLAILQGLQKFVAFSLSHLLAIGSKILLSALLIWLGFGVSGAIVGTLLSLTVMWLFVNLQIRSSLRCAKLPRAEYRYPWHFLLSVVLASLAFVSMTQLDIVLVRYHFDAEQSGVYAAAAILGKAVLYLPGAVVTALFPMVAENSALKKASASLLLNAVALTLALCSAGALIYLLFAPELVILLYGERYAEAGEVLRYFGLAMIPMALVLVAENFLIAQGRIVFTYLLVVAAPLQILAIHLFHQSLLMVVAILAIGGWVLVLVGYGILWREYRCIVRGSQTIKVGSSL